MHLFFQIVTFSSLVCLLVTLLSQSSWFFLHFLFESKYWFSNFAFIIQSVGKILRNVKCLRVRYWGVILPFSPRLCAVRRVYCRICTHCCLPFIKQWLRNACRGRNSRYSLANKTYTELSHAFIYFLFLPLLSLILCLSE